MQTDEQGLIAYIGLGSNLQQPVAQLKQALESLRQLPNSELLAVSSFYRSEPVGPQDQPDFVNAVAQIQTRLSASKLLSSLQAIENQQGRIRGRHWGERTLDLDILLYGEQIISTVDLQVPHVEMKNRSFVLIPLLEITDDFFNIPGLGRLKNLIESCPENHLEKLTDVSD